MTHTDSNQPLAPAPQRKRRLVVAVTYAAFFTGVAVILVSSFVDQSILSKVGGLIAAFSSFGGVYLQGGWPGNTKDETTELDERQREEVTTAYAYAYRILIVFISVVVLLLACVNLFEWKPNWPTLSDWGLVLTPMLILLTALPTAILAWTEPDLGDDEQ